MTDTGPDAATRALVHRRSEGLCERCRRRGATDVHHRRARGSGGSTAPGINGPANLVDLCRECHAWAEANLDAAVALGWKLRLAFDPVDARTVPVVDMDGVRSLLDDDGARWVRVRAGDPEPLWF